MLCLCSHASCLGCQERASTLKERNKWPEQHVWLAADLEASSASEDSLKLNCLF